MKILHYPSCSKSRETLKILQENGVKVEVIQYLETPLSYEELAELVQMLGIKPIDLIRKKEAVFKENFTGKELSDEMCLQAMVDFPRLMERPIFINGDKAIIGRPPENVLKII